MTFEIDAAIDQFTACDCSQCRQKNALMAKVDESELSSEMPVIDRKGADPTSASPR